MPGPVLVTVPDVEIAMVGEWFASTGPVTFTLADLEAAVAAQSDPGLRTPVLKLGHTDPINDGMPAFGRVTNLRVDYARQSLRGDLTGVPAWLVEQNDDGESILNSAFPDRSLEGYFELRSSTGRTHQFAVTALSLLGAEIPAIQNLEDVRAAYGVAAAASKPKGAFSGRQVVAANHKVALADTQVEDVRRAFYDKFEAEQSTYWWWIRAQFVNPPYVIADDDNGALYRVDYSVVNGSVEFADPQPVEIEYVPKAQAVAAKAIARYDVREASRPARLGTTRRTQEDSVDYRAALGLPADATEDEVAARIDALTSDRETEGEPNTGGAPEVGGGLQSDTQAPGNAPEVKPEVPSQGVPAPATSVAAPVAASGGLVTLDPATLQALQADAAAGRVARERQIADEREALLSGAIREGKFPLSRKAHWSALLAADPEGTKATIASLASGLIPVAEVGTAATPGSTPAAEATYPSSWFPEVASTPNGA